jgi:hypothetical protein
MENGLPVKDNSKKDKEKRIRSDVESISGSMQRLGKIKYNMHVMSKAMSISSSKLIDEGMKAYDKHNNPEAPEAPGASVASGKSALSNSSISSSLENSYADHLLGSKYYTDLCLGKKPNEKPHTQKWQLKSGTYDNLKEEGGAFVPRKESQTWDKAGSTVHQVNSHCMEVTVEDALKQWGLSKGDLKSDFKYMSMLLRSLPADSRSLKLDTFLTGFLNQKASPDYTPATDEIKNVVNGINHAIRGILTDEPGFRFHPTTVRSFKTRHCVVNVCEIKGSLEFEMGNVMYRVELCRKMVILNMVNALSSDHLKHVPICEEMFIQISRKYDDVETYYEHGMYITCKPKPPLIGKDSLYTQQMHYFGNNAFTMNLPPCHTEPFDKNRSTMKMVGAVVRNLQGVGSGDKNTAQKTYEFFRLIVDSLEPQNMNATQDNPSSIQPEKHIAKLKTSFLSNQHANEQTAVIHDKHPAIRIWMSSKSFSIVCISPAECPALNYVYVHLWESEIPGIAEAGAADAGNPAYAGVRSEAAFSKDTTCTLKPADSTLPLELELELALL